MKFNPHTGEPIEKAPGGSAPESTGFRRRIEAATKAHTHSPKGKGIVMMILGVVVLGALIWDFTGRGAASKAVRKNIVEGDVPVAPKRPGEGPPDATPPIRPASDPLQLEVKTAEGARLVLTPEAAGQLLASPTEDHQTLRVQLLSALVPAAGRKDATGARAFALAMRFMQGAGPDAVSPVGELTLRAYAALSSDVTAPTAILFLSRLPDGGGALAATALDEIIVDQRRPLHLRVTAARARPDTPRPSKVRDLATAANTHPALRDALAK